MTDTAPDNPVIYAQGQSDAVADAIRDHYKPAGQGDEVRDTPLERGHDAVGGRCAGILRDKAVDFLDVPARARRDDDSKRHR